MRETNDTKRLTWAPWMAIVTAAFAVEVPFFFLGTPSGHDVEFHLYSWLEVLTQWRQGIVYPRWAALANFGYGEPRFIFYPPASWTLGAALSAVFPWTWAPEIYIWLALVAAGASMFLLAREWMGRRAATFAAVLYAVNPYHLVIVYWRSALAELLAAALLPMLLLLVWQISERKTGEKQWRMTGPLALVLAGAWLVNEPAAVMIHYSMALLIAVIAWQRRSWRMVMVGVAAAALGAGLAAFYLLPAVYEQRWVDIGQAVAAGSRPLDNFIFVHTGDAEHDAFNRLISWIALVEIVVTLAAAWAAREWGRRNRERWYSLAGWAAMCMLLTVPVSNLFWSVLPKLRFMQFPWRWMLCLGIPFSLFLTVGVRREWVRVAVYAGTLCVLIFAWHHFQAPWWDTKDDLLEMQDNVATGAGYEGTEEYTPTGADPSAVDKDARRVTVEGPARAAIRVTEWTPEEKQFTAQMSAPDDVVLHLFNYPAWRVEVNGRVVQTGIRDGTGEMEVPLGAGENRVRITFGRTWDRVAGMWISVVAILGILFTRWWMSKVRA